jgi:hypothetical protein
MGEIIYVYMLHLIREIAQFMNWAENEQRIAQFVKWAIVICPVHKLGNFTDRVKSRFIFQAKNLKVRDHLKRYRRRSRWKDNKKIDLKEIGRGVD